MKAIKTIVAAFLVFSVVFTLAYGKNKIGEGVTVKNPKPEKRVISVWQIDTFEGGSGSRRKFLLDVARSFEKKNEEVLVMVSSHTIESARQGLKNGNYPDLVSYGNGAELSNLSEIKTRAVSDCGKIGDKEFAAVWCKGVYALYENVNGLAKKYDELTVSAGQYTLPLAALALEGKTAEEFTELSPLDAYVRFVSGKTRFLLGTQRDAVRLKNRGYTAKVTPLSGFSDLNQYISVTTYDKFKAVYAGRYINYLLSDDIQKKLYEINMFSPYVKVDYDDEVFINLQNALPEKTISAFVSEKGLSELKEFSERAVKGNEEALLKIKKVLL